MNRMLRYGLAAILSLLAISASAETKLLSLYRSGLPTDSVGAAGLDAVDVTGDGVRDLVTCAAGAPIVLAKKGAEYAPIWYGPNIACTAVTAADRDGDGTIEIIAAAAATESTSAEIQIFNPNGGPAPIAKRTAPTGNESIYDFALGDVDSDGHIELVAVTQNHTFVYAASSLLLEWDASGQGGYEVAVANIDDDGRIEIVVNSTVGRVLDAYARTLKWGYSGGFGQKMVIGNVDADVEAEIVFGLGGAITIVNGDDFSTRTFSLTDGYDTHAIALGDANNDGTVEIIHGRDQWGSIRGYTAAGTEVWSVYNPEHGVSAITVGDVDGDGLQEVCWGAGLTSSGSDKLFVASSTAVKASIRDLDGPYSTAVADLDGDGRLELIVANYSLDSGYGSGRVQVLDYETRTLEGTMKMTGTSPFPKVQQLEVGQLDSDAALEIVVFGSSWSNDGLYAFDGATYDLQWSSIAPSYSSPACLPGTLAVGNVDNDPVEEIVVALNDRTVQVFNGASPIIQYASSPLGSTPYDTDVADVNADGKIDIVVATDSGVHVLTPMSGASQLIALSGGTARVAAMTGRLATLNAQWDSSTVTVRMFNSALTQTSSCGWTVPSYQERTLAFGAVSGQPRLFAGTGSSLSILAVDGTGCTTRETLTLNREEVTQIRFADATGDGHPEMLLGFGTSHEIFAIGSSAEPRGDANRDGLITDTDIDMLARYLLADGSGISPSADVNGDGRIDLADVFYLINYRRGTGPAPVP